jgi:hypothetical protein
MRFASSSPHLLPTRTSCRIPRLKAISSPRTPSQLPPYASAAQSARQEPALMRRPHPPAQVQLIRNLFHPHRPTGRRDGLKLRVEVPSTQIMPSDYELLNLDAEIYGASLKNDCTAYLFIFLLFPRRMRLA